MLPHTKQYEMLFRNVISSFLHRAYRAYLQHCRLMIMQKNEFVKSLHLLFIQYELLIWDKKWCISASQRSLTLSQVQNTKLKKLRNQTQKYYYVAWLNRGNFSFETVHFVCNHRGLIGNQSGLTASLLPALGLGTWWDQPHTNLHPLWNLATIIC